MLKRTLFLCVFAALSVCLLQAEEETNRKVTPSLFAVQEEEEEEEGLEKVVFAHAEDESEPEEEVKKEELAHAQKEEEKKADNGYFFACGCKKKNK